MEEQATIYYDRDRYNVVVPTSETDKRVLHMLIAQAAAMAGEWQTRDIKDAVHTGSHQISFDAAVDDDGEVIGALEYTPAVFDPMTILDNPHYPAAYAVLHDTWDGKDCVAYRIIGSDLWGTVDLSDREALHAIQRAVSR